MATKREMLNAIATGIVNEEVIAWAAAEIEKLDAKNEARRGKVSPKEAEKRAENLKMVEKIVAEFLGDEPMTASQIGEVAQVSPQKASALMRLAVKNGLVEKTDVKVKGKGTQKGYFVAH